MREEMGGNFRCCQSANKILLVISAALIALSLQQPVNCWRLFDRFEGRLPGASLTLGNPFAIQSQLSLPSATSQLLAPMSAVVGNPQQQSFNGRQQQHVPISELPKPAAQQVASSLNDNLSKAESESMIGRQQQQQQRRAASDTDRRNTLPAPASESNQQAVNKSTPAIQQAIPAPSPVGKILDELTSRPNSTTTSAAAIDKMPQAMQHHLLLLKPKRQPAQSATLQAEQAIINQHSRATQAHNYSPNSLTTTKDQSFHLFDSSSSNGRDSTLASLLDNLKSGISSRSSIMKAMSDHKLAQSK